MITTINEFKNYLNINKIKDDAFNEYGDSDFYIIQYIHEELNGDTELEKILELDDYKSWFKYNIEIIIDELNDLIYNDITIYRKMSVTDEWFDKLRNGENLGIYWSYEQDAAETHWGLPNDKKSNIVELITTVDKSKINIENTIANAIIPYTGIKEKEIQLIKNIDIEIDKIIINDVEQDLSKFETLNFKA